MGYVRRFPTHAANALKFLGIYTPPIYRERETRALLINCLLSALSWHCQGQLAWCRSLWATDVGGPAPGKRGLGQPARSRRFGATA